MRSILSAVLVAILSLPGFAHADDIIPWPWGTECPFPWSNIEGDWSVKTDGNLLKHKFHFDIKGTWENGTRILNVIWYDASGTLMAKGEGLSSRGERIVRAAIGGATGDGNSYWAIVRAYHPKGKKSCSRTKLVTVITLRSFYEQEPDIHLELEKSVDEQKSKP